MSILVESSCIGFLDIVRKKQTDTQTNGGKTPTPTTAVVVDKNFKEMCRNAVQKQVSW